MEPLSLHGATSNSVSLHCSLVKRLKTRHSGPFSASLNALVSNGRGIRAHCGVLVSVADGAREQAKQLSRDLVASDSAEELIQLVAEHQEVLNTRHLSLALHRLAKPRHGAHPAAGDNMVTSTHPTVRWLLQKLGESKEEWTGVTISNTLEACIVLGVPPSDQVFDRAEAELCRVGRLWLPGDIVTLFHAMTGAERYLGRSLGGVVCELEGALLSHADINAAEMVGDESTGEYLPLREYRLWMFNAKQLGFLAWSLKELNCSESMADAFLVEALHRKASDFPLPPASLALVARTVVERGSRSNYLQSMLNLGALITHLTQRHGTTLSARDAGSLMSSLGKGVRKAAEQNCGDPVKSFDAQGSLRWSDMVEVLKESHPELERAAVHLGGATLPIVNRMDSTGLINFLHGLSQLQIPDRSLCKIILQRSMKMVPGMNFRQLSILAWSLAALRYDNEAVIETVARIVRNKFYGEKDTDCEFDVQSAAMVLYALAVLDRLDGPATAALLPVLIQDLTARMERLEPRALPQLGWSLVVAKGSPGQRPSCELFALQALQRWRRVVVAAAPSYVLTPVNLAALHHVEVAMRIECPGLGTEVPKESGAFFDAVYAAGRVRHKARQRWGMQANFVTSTATETQEVENEKQRISKFQSAVYRAACILSPGWILEFWDSSVEYPIDVALPSAKIALEADGPSHYTVTTRRLLGSTLLKTRLLVQLGWTVVRIPYFQWPPPHKTSLGNRAKFLQTVLREHGAERLIVSEHNQSVQNDTAGGAVGQSKGEREGCDDKGALLNREEVAGRASKLDLVRVRQGKLSLSNLVKLRALRKSTP